MALIDKQKVLDLIEEHRKSIDTEFDQADTNDNRKREINGGLTATAWLRQKVVDLKDETPPVKKAGSED